MKKEIYLNEKVEIGYFEVDHDCEIKVKEPMINIFSYIKLTKGQQFKLYTRKLYQNGRVPYEFLIFEIDGEIKKSDFIGSVGKTKKKIYTPFLYEITRFIKSNKLYKDKFKLVINEDNIKLEKNVKYCEMSQKYLTYYTLFKKES
jgi:hypothetical protein